jgi:hypothetical protein
MVSGEMEAVKILLGTRDVLKQQKSCRFRLIMYICTYGRLRRHENDQDITWRRGVVVIFSANGIEDLGFESRQDARFFGL